MKPIRLFAVAACAAATLLMSAQPEGRGRARAIEEGQAPQPQAQSDPQSFRFRSGVELVNVTATVTDQSGRFVTCEFQRCNARDRAADDAPYQ